MNTNRSQPTTRLASAFLAAVLGLTLLAPLAHGSVQLDGDTNVTVRIGTTEILGSSANTPTVWFNSLAGKAVSIDVAVLAGGEEVTGLLFGMENYQDDAKIFDFSSIVTPSFTPAWTNAATNDGGEDDQDGTIWTMPEPTLGCGLPLQPPCPDGIDAGESATFGVTLAPESLVDAAGQEFTVTVTDEFGGVNADSEKMSFGIDGTIPVIGTVTFSDGAGGVVGDWHSEADGAFTLTFTVTDAMSGVDEITANNGSLGGVGCTSPADLAGPDNEGPTSVTCTLSAMTLSEGSNVINLNAKDAAGNSATQAQVTIKIDTTAPSLVVSATNPLVTGGTSHMVGADEWFSVLPSVDVEVTDGAGVGLDTASFEYRWAAQSFAPGALVAGVAAADPAGLSDGASALDVTVDDLAHAPNSAALNDILTLRFDGTAPSIDSGPTTIDLDTVGNADGEMDAAEMTEATGPNDFFTVSYTTSDGTGSGIALVELLEHRPADAAGVYNVYTSSSSASGSFNVVPTQESNDIGDNPYCYKIRVTDGVGRITTTSDLDAICFEVHPPADQVARLLSTTLTATVGAIEDIFTTTGTFVSLNVHVNNDLALVQPSPARNVHVDIYEDGGASPITTVTTNLLGDASFSIQKTVADEHEYVAIATEQLAGAVFAEATENNPPADRTLDVTWTQLVAASVDDFASDLYGRGDGATLQLGLEWAHAPGVPAAGLTGTNLGFTVVGSGAGAADPLVGPMTGTMSALGATESGSTAGLYEVAFTHNKHESLTFTATGNLVGYDIGADDAPTTFTVQTDAADSMVRHWVGAITTSLAFTNLDEAGDTTDRFVNEDERIQVDATIKFTANYDPSNVGGNLLGLPGDGAGDRSLATGTTAGLFQTSTIAGGATPPTGNGDAVLTITDGSGADNSLTPDGIIRFVTDIDSFDAVAETYGILVFPENLGTEFTQDVTASGDVTDYGATSTETFTGVTVDYVADSLTGSTDPALADIPFVDELLTDPWWFQADLNAVADMAGQAVFQVDAAFTHDPALPAAGATLGAFFAGSGLPVGGLTPLQATTDPTGLATFTIDPDAYGLDFAIQDLVFRVVSAPEPDNLPVSGAPEDITFDAGNFDHSFLWTMIHLIAEANPLDGDLENNIGDESVILVSAYWYHDSDDDGSSLGLDDALDTGDIVDQGVEGDFDLSLTDSLAPMARVVTVASILDLTVDGLDGENSANFNVARGCADPSTGETSCIPSRDVDEAGWHTFTPGLGANPPHGISATSTSVDVLWTAVVLDASTDRLTAPVGTGLANEIDFTVRAYFAHTDDAEGVDIPLASAIFDRDVIVQLCDGDCLLPGGPMSGTFTVAGGSAAGASRSFFTALPRTVLAHAEAGNGVDSVDDPEGAGNLNGIYDVFESPELKRAWLELSILPGTTDDDADGPDPANDDDATDTNDFTVDEFVVRGTDVEVSAKLELDDGVAQTFIDDAYGGYALTSTETATAVRQTFNNPAFTLGDRVLQTDPTDLGTTPTALAFTLTGDETAPTDLDLAYDGSDIWTVTVPGAAHEDVQTVLFDIDASLQVTNDALLTPDLATIVTDSEAPAFSVVYSAIDLTLLTEVQDDGNIWENLGEDASIEVRATWAHDDSNAVGVEITVENPNLADAIWATGTTGLDGEATILVPSDLVSSLESYEFFATEAPDLEDETAVFTDGELSSDNLLTNTGISPEVIFTRVVFAYGLGSPCASSPCVANVDEGVPTVITAAWEHSAALITDRNVAIAFPVDGVEQNTITGSSGAATVSLVSATADTFVLAPSLENEPRTITVCVVAGGSSPGAGTESYGCADSLATAPSIRWTRMFADLGLTTGTTVGTGVNPPHNGAPIFATTTVATQPMTLELEDDLGTGIDDATATIGGVSGSTSGGGTLTKTFTSFTEGWYDIVGRGVSYMLGTKEITATTLDNTYIGFDNGVDPALA